ncbi:MAG TPA: winged helix-turn-helix domain-containing protein [Nitrososphaera sp.]
MAATLLQKDVRTKRITTLGHVAARALNDAVRLRILEILSHRSMSAEELTKALGTGGLKKATTTIRHHLDTLKKAGLIEATKMVEVRGAVMKYYAPTLRAFSYSSPADLDLKHSKLIEDTSSKLLKVMKAVYEDKKLAASFDSKNGAPCNLCKTNHFREFIVMEILNSATVRAMEKQEYADVAGGRESRPAIGKS